MIVENPPKLPSKEGIGKYVQSDLFSWFKNLVTGLNGRLSFDENFNSFVVNDIAIAAGATAVIDNQLGVIPNERYIVRQTGNGVITDGNWTIEALELVNNGSVAVVISVRFFYVNQFTTGR